MKKTIHAFLAAASLMAAFSSMAASTATPPTDPLWVAKRGTTVVGQGYANEDACWAAAAARVDADARSGNYTCHVERSRRYTWTAAPAPCTTQPSVTTATIACAAGLAPPWDQTTTVTVSPAPACVVTTTLNPTSAPAGACQPIVVPTGPTYYFSDCQVGAASGCVAGLNSNPGTQAAPKRDFIGFNHNSLPAGSTLYLARGGAWDISKITLENMNVSAAAPLTFDAYGTGPAPWGRAGAGADHLFDVGGNWGNTTNDGGYVIRNLKLDGAGTADWGFWFAYNVRDVIIENNEITGFAIALNSNDGTPHGVRGITLRNNNIHHNSDMGLLGHYDDMLIEGNTIEANNFGGGGFSHGTYIGGGHNITIRNNLYLRNSVVNGVCNGGNMTFHGQIDGLLIEGNRIEQDQAVEGCWLMSITRGYTTPEWFTNTVVRNNKLINGGNNGVAAQSAPGIIVEGNVAINTRPTNQTSFAIGVGPTSPTTGGDAGDVGDTGAIVRDNIACQSGGASGSVVSVNSPGGTVSGNVVVTGAAATTGVCAR